jgi:uncharacterized membrane protein
VLGTIVVILILMVHFCRDQKVQKSKKDEKRLRKREREEHLRKRLKQIERSTSEARKRLTQTTSQKRLKKV